MISAASASRCEFALRRDYLGAPLAFGLNLRRNRAFGSASAN
jgi:hypothetical protein